MSPFSESNEKYVVYEFWLLFNISDAKSAKLLVMLKTVSNSDYLTLLKVIQCEPFAIRS